MWILCIVLFCGVCWLFVACASYLYPQGRPQAKPLPQLAVPDSVKKFQYHGGAKRYHDPRWALQVRHPSLLTSIPMHKKVVQPGASANLQPQFTLSALPCASPQAETMENPNSTSRAAVDKSREDSKPQSPAEPQEPKKIVPAASLRLIRHCIAASELGQEEDSKPHKSQSSKLPESFLVWDAKQKTARANCKDWTLAGKVAHTASSQADILPKQPVVCKAQVRSAFGLPSVAEDRPCLVETALDDCSTTSPPLEESFGPPRDAEEIPPVMIRINGVPLGVLDGDAVQEKPWTRW